MWCAAGPCFSCPLAAKRPYQRRSTILNGKEFNQSSQETTKPLDRSTKEAWLHYCSKAKASWARLLVFLDRVTYSIDAYACPKNLLPCCCQVSFPCSFIFLNRLPVRTYESIRNSITHYCQLEVSFQSGVPIHFSEQLTCSIKARDYSLA